MSWKEKIKPGLYYRIVLDAQGKYEISAAKLLSEDGGIGTAIDFGEAMEKLGLPDEKIQNSIEAFFNQQWVPLSEINILKPEIMEKIPTAKEFIAKYLGESEEGGFTYSSKQSLYNDLVEFAKLHVAASKKAILELLKSTPGSVSEDSILNTYPETLIK